MIEHYFLIWSHFHCVSLPPGFQHLHRRRVRLHHHHADVPPTGLLQRRRGVSHLPLPEMVRNLRQHSLTWNVASGFSELTRPCPPPLQALPGGQNKGQRIRSFLRREAQTEVAQGLKSRDGLFASRIQFTSSAHLHHLNFSWYHLFNSAQASGEIFTFPVIDREWTNCITVLTALDFLHLCITQHEDDALRDEETPLSLMSLWPQQVSHTRY